MAPKQTDGYKKTDPEKAEIEGFKCLKDFIPKEIKPIDEICADEKARLAEIRRKANTKARNDALKASKASKKVDAAIIQVRLPSGRYIVVRMDKALTIVRFFNEFDKKNGVRRKKLSEVPFVLSNLKQLSACHPIYHNPDLMNHLWVDICSRLHGLLCPLQSLRKCQKRRRATIRVTMRTRTKT